MKHPMAPPTTDVTLEITPETRIAVIDAKKELSAKQGERLAPYSKLLCCSHHTTAGFLEQSLCARIQHRQESIEALVHSAQHLFPKSAPYRHNEMSLRSELPEAQKLVEPLNADSHLAFIGLGMENCVTYDNHPEVPVYFIDLDGVFEGRHRRRIAQVIGFNRSATVVESTLQIPVSHRAIDSVNLSDPRNGIQEQLEDIVKTHDVRKGKIVLSLAPSERHAGLTVNEYETLLMKHDLMEVLRNPLWFMARGATNMVRDPRAVPKKAKGYIKYDLVHVVNQVIHSLGLNESLIERVIDRIAARSASRRLRLKRSVTMLVDSPSNRRPGTIVYGTYQSPILIQWQKAGGHHRTVHVRLIRFE